MNFEFTDTNTDSIEADSSGSTTAAAIHHIALYGLKSADEPNDPPDEEMLAGIAQHTMEAFAGAVEGTPLERNLDELLWSFVNVFHRRLSTLQLRLDENEDAQRLLAESQDGSEVKSVELERKLAEGEALMVRRDAFEALRDAAANEHALLTGSPWMPRSGSRTSSNAKLTSAVIDSRDWRAAKRRRETDANCPVGTRIAFTGGLDFTDHTTVFHALDRTRAKHADMVLMHGGSPTRRRAHRREVGRRHGRPAGGLPPRLDPTRQGRPVQAQRRAARRAAHRPHRLPGLRDHRQPRRQGAQARHPRHAAGQELNSWGGTSRPSCNTGVRC